MGITYNYKSIDTIDSIKKIRNEYLKDDLKDAKRQLRICTSVMILYFTMSFIFLTIDFFRFSSTYLPYFSMGILHLVSTLLFFGASLMWIKNFKVSKEEVNNIKKEILKLKLSIL